MEFINQTNVIEIIEVLLVTFLSVFTAAMFILTLCRFKDLSQVNKKNKKALSEISFDNFFERIYKKKVVEYIVLDKHLEAAYEEYRHQNSILLKKAAFYFSLQVIFGGLFAFAFKYFYDYLNILFFIPLLFGITTFLLFSNMENVYNKIANILIYIRQVVSYKKQHLMDFFENGFYKQNYDDDRNLFAIFTAFIAPVWIFIGIFMLSKDIKELAVLLIFTLIILMASLANWQYKNRKEYKLLDKDKK